MGNNQVSMTLNGFLPKYYISKAVDISIYSFFVARTSDPTNEQPLREIARDYIQIFDVEHSPKTIVRIYSKMCHLKKDINIKVKYS